ncbi:hypothetical protein PRIO_1398 [Paenibacillus riograndensis SBR5]|uniref:Uncharacterized protein n=1 Tax=Paenibacillus riograndensis SBR5 TaxID=1073571 RepID=A0A0E4HBH4_9BACL|nr:hypothetical protein PRIO_1398 [Paenibacillus riograndensis SBR5]
MAVESLLMWERGLKLRPLTQMQQPEKVAPYVGAWIEIESYF